MGLVSFGQPDDGIIQTSYIVEDMRRAIDHWVSKLKVGPWFLLDHFTGEEPVYRGQPSQADVEYCDGLRRPHEHRADPAQQ